MATSLDRSLPNFSHSNFFIGGVNATIRMLRFAAYTAAETPNAFQWARLPPKCTLSEKGFSAASNTWFLRPTRVSHTNGISIGSGVFTGLTRVPDRQTVRQTDRQTTLRMTSVAMGRIYTMHAIALKITQSSRK